MVRADRAFGGNYFGGNRRRATAEVIVGLDKSKSEREGEIMNLIEIRHPAGGLTPEDQAAMATEIATWLDGDMGGNTAPESTLRRAKAMTHVAFAELAGWQTGDGLWGAPGSVPPLWITVTIPEAWREEMARHEIGRLRRAVRRVDANHGWYRPDGWLWINIVGIADGSIGMDGKGSTADDVVAGMSREFQVDLDAGTIEVPEGMLLDPMCGMLVKDRPQAITFEYDGTTYGFCARSCRDAFMRQRASL